MQDINTKWIKRIAENLIRIRESKGYSQSQLALLSGVDRSKINKIEKAKVDLYVTTLLHLAKGLGVSPKKLLDFDIDG